MIEGYFQEGLLLKWKFPGEVFPGKPKDGTVLNNRERLSTPMVYQGMDVLTPFGGTTVNHMGLALGQPLPIQYIWLAYAPGHTTKNPLMGRDVLTGFMSGCLVTLWREQGLLHVGHIGTDGTNLPITRLVKQKFAAYMPRDTTGFNPVASWDEDEILKMRKKFTGRYGPPHHVLALVTTAGRFYSILLFELMNEDWCVGGCRPVPPMDYHALTQRLL
jgi:hypothetical protein